MLESTVFQTEIHRDIFQLERGTSECWNSSRWIEVWKSYFLTLWVSKFFTTTFYSLFNVCKVMNKNTHFLLKNNVVSLILLISHVGDVEDYWNARPLWHDKKLESKIIISKGPPLGSVWESKTFPHWSQGGVLGSMWERNYFSTPVCRP